MLAPWIQHGALWGCGVIRVEVLRGIVNSAQKDRIAAFFDVLPEIPSDANLWQEVTDLAWRLDRSGKVLPLTDLMIAVSAQRVGATVISLDEHFAQIPNLVWHKELPPG